MQSRAIASLAARRAIFGARLQSVAKQAPRAVWSSNNHDVFHAPSGRTFVTATQSRWMPVKTVDVWKNFCCIALNVDGLV